MNCRLALVVALVPACGPSLTARERMVTRMFADARRDEATFAAHFDPGMAREQVRALRDAFARESPPRFEQERGPVCVRAYWGEWVIDHGYYIYLRPSPGGFVVTDVESDSGFGPALASVGALEDRLPSVSVHDRCTAANAAAAAR